MGFFLYIWDTLVWLAVAVRLLSHRLWIWGNRSIHNATTGTLPVKGLSHKVSPQPVIHSAGLGSHNECCNDQIQVLVLGDGFAAGIGDWVMMTQPAGLERYLQQLFNQDDNVRGANKLVLVS